MKLLLDSHAFLWAVMTPEKLGKKAQGALSARGNEAFVSKAPPHLLEKSRAELQGERHG